MKLKSATRNVGLAAAALSLGTLAVGLTSTAAFAQSANTFASSTESVATNNLKPQNENYYYQYRTIQNVYQGQYGGDWGTCNYAQQESIPATYQCNRSVTTSASIGGGIGNISVGEISALIGFSINWSYTEGIGSGFSVTVSAGGYGPLLAGSEYWQHYVVSQYRLCTVQGNCDAWGGNQANTVQRYDSPTYKYGGVY